MKKWVKRSFRTLLSAAMLAGVMPWAAPAEKAEAAGQYEDVYIYGRKVYNASDYLTNPPIPFDSQFDRSDANHIGGDAAEYDAFNWFLQVKLGGDVPGVSYNVPDVSFNGPEFVHGTFKGTIKVSEIPQLKQLAMSGQGEFRFFVRQMYESDDDYVSARITTSKTGYSKFLEQWGSDWAADNKYISTFDCFDTGWRTFAPDDEFKFELTANGTANMVGIHLYFRDITPPTVKDYVFDSNGTEQDNTTTDEKELLLKWGDSFSLAYPFSEPLKAYGAAHDLNSHDLFTNPGGTGLPGAGLNQGMKLPASTDWTQYTDKLNYSYQSINYQHTGNLPIMNGGELTSLPASINLNEKSLLQKVTDAEFHDAAGNPLNLSNFAKKAAANAGASFLRGKAINPFDSVNDKGNANDGYQVIIDAVPPKYSFTANGIQPEIVTGSTLNKGDTIDFKVQLTEETIPKKGLSASGLFLHFNNGMKAYYVDGANTKTWTFRATVTEDELDVALLKVIALTHESRANDSIPYGDKGVIQDYAGNLLTDAVNTSKSNPPPTDASQQVANTKIDWARLSIDNTPPSIGYSYDTDGADASKWGKTGKISIDANDPGVTAPALDPDEPGQVRPSRGIYRPLNMTGGSGDSPGVGLVYYYWSQNPEDPLTGKEGDHFAAVKRYTLTGEQPRQGLYPGQLPDFNLMAANNKTNLLAPPAMALTAENSGTWYLHTWTADMTWDTARELMQYRKMTAFKADNGAVYNGWFQEYLASHPQGSETDAEVYANGKAMEAVGDYGDLSLWQESDFKQDDSNWVYNKASIQLDNKAPQLSASISGVNDTAAVKAAVEASDEHSGLDTAKLQFQWVRTGEQPVELNWQAVPADRVVTTLNRVIEDGEYILYLQAADKAGNEAVYQMPEHAIVNSQRNVSVAFSPEGTDAYAKSGDIAVSVSGTAVQEVKYAYSPSAARPADSAFVTVEVPSAVTGAVYDPAVTEMVYGASVTGVVYGIVPADYSLNGDYYLHVRIKEADTGRYYYSNAPYRFDNTAPAATFSINGVSYPKAAHQVTVSVAELYNPSGMTVSYQWVPEGDPKPDEAYAAWLPLPDDGNVAISSDRLSPGESASFVLYVLSKDGIGNLAVTGTNPFNLYRADTSPITVLQSNLIDFAGDAAAGYKATLQLELERLSKDGFEYNISKDDGLTWTAWRPYTNFAQIAVAENNPSKLRLKVKFRSPAGVESDAVAVDTAQYSGTADMLYALASYSTLKPVKGGGLTLTVSAAPGIKVTPSANENPGTAVRVKGNSFVIPQNGVYTFDLEDLTAQGRKGKLLAVVNNVDDTPPEGSVEYSITGPTAANVTAKLSASEPVRILNNDGRNSVIFNENGMFTFRFEDEAGNIGSATASVDNINRTPPSVKLTKSYTYGQNGAESFQTIEDERGNVVLSAGVKLTVEKTNAGAKDFLVVQGENPTVLLENGEAQFVVQDVQGNTAVVQESIGHIAPELEQPEIVYSYVDGDGNPLPADRIVTINGKSYARGYMKVALSGKIDAPNQLFQGMVPILEGEGYNKISKDDGTYAYSAIYRTNGRTRIVLADLLGRSIVAPIEVDGLDNTPPEIKLNRPVAAVLLNQPDFDPLKDLGGFTATDNVSSSDHLIVTVSDVNLSQAGRQTVTYTVTDETGNQAVVTQEVVVMDNSGLLVIANGQVLSAALQEKVLFDTNRITFSIVGYDKMNIGGAEGVNEKASYTLLYHSGLYREGQMKYIAEELTLEQLKQNEFRIVFPKTGWYTLVVRTQEREREFVSFFVGSTEP